MSWVIDELRPAATQRHCLQACNRPLHLHRLGLGFNLNTPGTLIAASNQQVDGFLFIQLGHQVIIILEIFNLFKIDALDDVTLDFSLPAGSYATQLVREFTRDEFITQRGPS